MQFSVRLCAATRARTQRVARTRRVSPFKYNRADLQNRPITRVNTIVIRPSVRAKHPALQIREATPGSKVVESFSKLYLRGDVVQALTSVGISQPTVIQMLAIPKIAAGKNVLCAAETGSGKTLAYLAPLISQLRNEEENHGVIPRLKRPRALILLPSRDLAAQVLSVCKSLCHEARFRAVGLIGGIRRRFIKDSLSRPVDVAIATPDSLLRYRREQRVFLSDLKYFIIDEADTLFDPSFEDATTSILKSLRISTKKPTSADTDRGEGTQVVIVGATLSTKMMSKIERLIPNIKKASSKHLHQILPHIEQRFIKVHQSAKADKLLFMIQNNPNDVVIVFCNTVPSCDWIAGFLRDYGIKLIKLHGGFSPLDRKHLLRYFKDGATKVLVCTDIASRGIDTSHVNHVILFDFPNTLPDYLHRVGRTGRVGSVAKKCKATAFMTHRRDVQMAWQIKDSSERRDAIMNRRMVDKLEPNTRTASRDSNKKAIAQ